MLVTWWRATRLWYRQRAAISALQSLSDRMLKDIGMDRSEIPSIVHGLGRDTSRRIRDEQLVRISLQSPL